MGYMRQELIERAGNHLLTMLNLHQTLRDMMLMILMLTATLVLHIPSFIMAHHV